MRDRDKTKEQLLKELGDARVEMEHLRAEFSKVERALRKAISVANEERDKTRAVIEAIGEGISVQDTHYRILLQNEFQRDMVGDHVGEYCYRAYRGLDSVCPGCHLAMAFGDGRIHKSEQQRITDEGIRYYEITASPLKDSSGRIIAGIEAVRDITERRRAEDAIKDTNARLESLIQAIPDQVFFKDVHGRHLMVNKAVEEFTGSLREEFLGKTAEEMLPDPLAEECRRSDEEAIRSCTPLHFEEHLLNGRGDERLLETIKSPIFDATGAVVGVVGVSRDMTERRRVEMALHESEERYRALFENAVDAILIFHAEGEERGRIVAANRAAARMHGYTIEELLRLTIADLDEPTDARMVPRRIDRVLKKGSIKVELNHCRKDGSCFPVEISAGVMELGGRKYIFAFDRDITDRKNYEQEREALIAELKEALEKIRTLKGLLPICAWCKKIRDDQGYWKKVEDYIQERSDATFTHGICPECLREHSPDLYRKIADGGEEV